MCSSDLYRPDIGIISGIAWDHINVFPTFGNYVEQFAIFARMIPENGQLIYCQEDEELRRLAAGLTGTTRKPYGAHPYVIRDGVTYLTHDGLETPLRIFGRHNLMNLNAARLACNAIGVPDGRFYEAIATFKGASKRLELVAETPECAVYKDFAHSPSKLKATIGAVREQYPGRRLVACMELHTFSSLTEEFLRQYAHAMDEADTAIVYYSPAAVAHKKLPPIRPEAIFNAFQRDDLHVCDDSEKMKNDLTSMDWRNSVLLLMSSGNFDGINLNRFGEKIVSLRVRNRDN